MNQEEKQYLKDKRYITVKDIFFRNLNERNDIRISSGDAEETFLALWIFLNKKKPHVFSGLQEPVNISTAETFYQDHINESPDCREYLRKLLISYKSE